MARPERFCTDPSHPPILRYPGQETLFEQVLAAATNHEREGLPQDEIVRLVSSEFIPRLTDPSSCVSEGFRLQQMREQIARDWKGIFSKLENLGHLTGWFVNECAHDEDTDELHLVLSLLAFESIRNLFAIVNQLRSALTQDTFGYLRTLHETLVKSRFLIMLTGIDPDLPGRFSYYTNTTYLDFYRRFAPVDDEYASNNMWVEAERYYEARFKKQGKGDYGWAYPLVKSKKGTPISKPTFQDLMDAVDSGSAFSCVYYDVSTSKTHGQFIWSPLMVRPEGRGTHLDSFSVGNVGLVLDLMVPLFEEVLENTIQSCNKREHALVMSIVRAITTDIRESVAKVKTSNPDMHLGLRDSEEPA